MTRRASWLVLLLCLLALGVSSPVSGWSGNTHRKMVSDALQRMPSGFLARFAPFKKEFMRGATYPDAVLKDFQNHVFHVGDPKHQGAAQFCGETFASLIQDMKGKLPDSELSFRLGVFAHYLADWNQPLHTAGSNVDPQESDYHLLFERDVESQLSTIPIGTISPAPVTHPESRLREMAATAFADYAAIGKAYRQGNKIFDLRNIVTRQYQAGVQTIVDFWIAILRDAGERTLIEDPRRSPVPSLQASPIPVVANQQAVDLNTADLEELMKLPGIGAAKGRAIIAARPFRSPYDLARVKGFGAKSVERLLERIKVVPGKFK